MKIYRVINKCSMLEFIPNITKLKSSQNKKYIERFTVGISREFRSLPFEFGYLLPNSKAFATLETLGGKIIL